MNETNTTMAKAPASKTKLNVGDVFKNEKGADCVVWFGSESHVKIAPLTADIRHSKSEDGVIRFAVGKGGASKSRAEFSPEVTESLGREGLAARIDSLKAAEPEKKPRAAKAPKAAGEKKARGPRAGSLGNFQGFSIASVVRALAWKGWRTPEVRAFLAAQKLEASDQTIKLNVYRGKNKDHHAKHTLAALKTFPAKPVIEQKAKPAKAPKTAPVKKPAAKSTPKATAPAKKPAAAKPAASANEAGAVEALKKMKAEKAAAAKASPAATA